MSKQAKERWMFTEEELRNPTLCKRDDEFVCTDSGGGNGVICQRTGEPTNRFEDGTVGVGGRLKDEIRDVGESFVKVIRDSAGRPLSLSSGATVEQLDADQWYDVWTNEAGKFIKFVKPH